jgi:hypothetical protein
MKNSILLIVFMSWAMSSQLAFAGNSVGNGGNVVVCKDAAARVTSIELLDYYEGKVLRGITPETGAPALDYHQKIDYVLDRFAEVAPHRAARYRDQARSFESEALFLAGAQLVPVPDSQHSFVPDGCEVDQAAIQKTPEFPEDKRYTVNQDLWSQLPAEGKAGLVLHEVIYREAIEHNQDDSVKARYFNSYVAAGKLNSYSPLQLVDFYQTIEFPTAEAQGIEFVVGEDPQGVPGNVFEPGQADPYRVCERLYEFFPDGRLKTVDLAQPASVPYLNLTLLAESGSSADCSQNLEGSFALFDSGAAQRFSTVTDKPIPLAGGGSIQLLPPADQQDRLDYQLELSADGKILKVASHLYEYASLQWRFVARGREFTTAASYNLTISDAQDQIQIDPDRPDQTFSTPVHGVDLVLKTPSRSFVPDWSASTWTGVANNESELPVGTVKAVFLGSIDFDPTHGDRVLRGCIAESAHLPNVKGHLTSYRKGCVLRFDEQGRVAAVESCDHTGDLIFPNHEIETCSGSF